MTDELSRPPIDPQGPEDDATSPGGRPSRRRLWIIGGSVAGAVAVLMVTGLAVAAALSGGATAIPAPTESRTPTPTSSAEQTPEPLLAPAGLDVPCEQLLPASLVGSIMAPNVSLLQDSGRAASSLEAAVLRADAGAYCRWSNEVGPSTGAQEEIELEVISGAAAAYLAEREKIVDDHYTRFDLAGDASNQNCGVWGTEFYCYADVLVDDLWVHIDASHHGAAELDEDAVHDSITSLLRAAASGARGADGSGLKAPDWLATSAELCSLTATVSGAPFADLGIDYGFSRPWTEAEERGDVIVCRVPDSANSGITIYPGLAWAWSDILAGGQNMADLQAVDIPGADAAASGPSWDGRSTFISVGGAIVTTWEEGANGPSALATQLAAAYAAAPTP
jgi:hypothetical protein